MTGGAGYIGQHVVRAALTRGHRVVVIDNLSSGSAELLPEAAQLVVGAVEDPEALDEAFGLGVTGVVHLAALKSVDESIEKPLDYTRVNVEGTRCVLETMVRHQVPWIVYSSSAAVYGEVADGIPVAEEAPTQPVNPYGRSKLVGEWLLRDVAAAHPLSWVALRYFNVAGSRAPNLADRGARNLVPVAVRAVAEGRRPVVFGDDYATADGTCVRDYIHVVDLADAHLAAFARASRGDASGIYNVGTGRGASVLEVMAALSRATGRDLSPVVGPRRPGDPASVVADTRRVSRGLSWRARYGIDEIVRSAWEAAVSPSRAGMSVDTS